MPVIIEQWRAEIGSFNSFSVHSIVKLHLNLFNLLFNMFLVSFLFLCDFLPFLSTSISYRNFNHYSKFIFIKRSFTNYLYITSFIDVVYSTYFFHILLLQHGDIETNPGPQKKKKKSKIFPAAIGILTAL